MRTVPEALVGGRHNRNRLISSIFITYTVFNTTVIETETVDYIVCVWFHACAYVLILVSVCFSLKLNIVI